MKTLAELAKELEERDASITIHRDTDDDYVVWLFDPVDPTILFVADDHALDVAIKDAFEAWDADAAENEETETEETPA